MDAMDSPSNSWDIAIPRMSDEGLLLAEMSHRVRNEVGASIAAMRLSLKRKRASGREAMVRSAIGRLEGFGELLGLMSVPPNCAVNLAPALQRMCECLLQGRSGVNGTVISVDASAVWMTSESAQRVLMIAHELLHNAIRHALDGRNGMLAIVLRANPQEVRLAVIDDGPGIRRGSGNGGSGMGSPITSELVRRAGGQIECRTSADGTKVRVCLPGTAVVTPAEF